MMPENTIRPELVAAGAIAVPVIRLDIQMQSRRQLETAFQRGDIVFERIEVETIIAAGRSSFSLCRAIHPGQMLGSDSSKIGVAA